MKTIRKLATALSVGAVLATGTATTVQAEYPERQITIVIGFPPAAPTPSPA